MPADFVTNQGDTAEIFTQQILAAGEPVDLGGATIQLNVRGLTQLQAATITGTVTSPTPASGIVQWQPSLADVVNNTGDLFGKWVVTYSNGQQQQYPTDGFIWIRIEPSVGSIGQALVSLPDVKDYLSASGVNHDAKLLHYIAAATPIVENVVGPIIIREIEEWHQGGNTHISLRRTPSTSLGTNPVLTLVACSEYLGPIEWNLAIIATPDEGQLYSCMLNPRLGTVVRRTAGGGVQPFPNNGDGQDVHVVYQTGQQTVPENVRNATLEAIREYYQNTQATGGGSRTIADEETQGSVAGFSMFLNQYVRGALAPNRRHPSLA